MLNVGTGTLLNVSVHEGNVGVLDGALSFGMVVVFFIGVLNAGVLSVVVGIVVSKLCVGMGAVLNVGVVWRQG